MVNKYDLAFTIPCFNEAERIDLKYWEEIFKLDDKIFWLFVNDGSTDKTIELLKQLSFSNCCEILNLPKNVGKSEALRQGFIYLTNNEMKFDGIGFIDADGAFEKADILNLIELFRNSKNSLGIFWDSIIASRIALAGRDINRKPLRHYIGRIFATVATIHWRKSPYDTQCGLKIFRNNLGFQMSILDKFKTRWFIDLELFSRMSLNNQSEISILEIPLNSWSDIAGSKLGVRQKIISVMELFLVSKMLKKNIYLNLTEKI